MDLELGGDITGDDLGGEAPRGLGPAPIDHSAIDDEGDPLGTAEVEVVADGRLEPGSGPARLVEHRGVGDLELGDGEGPIEPGPSIVRAQRIGDDGHHAGQESVQMARTEAGADAVRRGGVFDGTQPVVEGVEADAGLGQLAFGPLMSVGTAPQRVGRVRGVFDEGRAPFGVGEVEVPVVGHRGLAAPGEVGVTPAMGIVGGVDVAPPRRGPLLGLADEHQTGAAGQRRLVLVGACHVFFGLASLEADHRHPGAFLELGELGDEPFVIALEQHWRGDGATSIEEELDHPPFVLEPLDVTPHADAVHRSTAKAHVLVQ